MNNKMPAAEVVVVPLRKVVLDVILLMCVGFPILFLFLWGVPYHRGFFCDDQDLIHPFKPSTISSLFLYGAGAFNILLMILIEFLNRTKDNNKEIRFCGWKIPNWVYNAYYVILVYAFGMACQQLTTDILKYTVGRLRPHFYNVCIPSINCEEPENKNVYHINFHCTNPEYNSNKRIMKEMRLSFPSGHSSFSIYTMLYFAIYLHKRMDWDGSKLLRHTLQFLVVIAALFTAMTRISDYKHHWSDVMGGLTIGTIYACVVARYFSTLFNSEEENETYGGRDVTELQGLNGNSRQLV